MQQIFLKASFSRLNFRRNWNCIPPSSSSSSSICREIGTTEIGGGGEVGSLKRVPPFPLLSSLPPPHNSRIRKEKRRRGESPFIARYIRGKAFILLSFFRQTKNADDENWSSCCTGRALMKASNIYGKKRSREQFLFCFWTYPRSNSNTAVQTARKRKNSKLTHLCGGEEGMCKNR